MNFLTEQAIASLALAHFAGIAKFAWEILSGKPQKLPILLAQIVVSGFTGTTVFFLFADQLPPDSSALPGLVSISAFAGPKLLEYILRKKFGEDVI